MKKQLRIVRDNFTGILNYLVKVDGIKQEDLAASLGVSQGTISKMSRGLLDPSLEVITHLSHKYDYNMNDVFTTQMEFIYPEEVLRREHKKLVEKNKRLIAKRA